MACYVFTSLSYIASLSFLHVSKLTLLLHTHHLKHHHHLTFAKHFSSSSSSSSLLYSCKDLQTLKQLHASLILSSGFEPVSIAPKLIALYAKFHDLESAVSVFNALREPDTATWNSIIKSHVDLGRFDLAFLLYRRMRELGVKHDSFTFPVISRAISVFLRSVWCAEMVHCVAVKMGFGSDLYFCNTMIDAYGKCGFVGCARELFDEMCHRDLVTWTSMISGYVCEGNVESAFKLFGEMRMELEPNSVTVMVMLQACSTFVSVIEGREFHGYVIKKGFLNDGLVQNSVLTMYTKMDSEGEVEKFFGQINERDFVSWNVLISFYSLRGEIEKVVESFNEMQSEVISPSIETLTSVVSAFAKSGNLLQGEKLHCFVIKSGLCDNILQTSLLDFYAKCGKLETSVQLFRDILHRNNITWSAMMSAFIQNGYFSEAVELFHQMQGAGLEPGSETLKCLIIAYTHLGALRSGKEVHAYLIRRDLLFNCFEDYILLETSMLNMYVRCGSISSARICFNRMVIKDIVSWTSMIEGFGSHGLGSEAMELFGQMVEEGIEPNSVSFLSLLSACSHSGLVGEGCEVFYSMKCKFGIDPNLDHYTCLVDLLGRSGKLREALTIIVKMVAFPDGRIWGALLAASRIHGNSQLSEYAAQRLLELEPENVGYYTLLSNVQASFDRWTEVEEVRTVVSEKDLKKKPGWSCIEGREGIHGFVSGDRSHHQVEEIYRVLGCLGRETQVYDKTKFEESLLN